MKDIEFRAWDKKTKKMLYVEPASSIHRDMTWTGLVYNKGKLLKYEMMQYTGIKDKNGKKIFEDDVVRLPNKDECRIVFHTGDDRAMFIGVPVRSHHGFKEYMYWCGEVVGNVHENPEYLEVKFIVLEYKKKEEEENV
jgi:uncharacterized phage protein (TIGR01671 family)